MFTSFVSLAISAVLGLNPVLVYPVPAPSPTFTDDAGYTSALVEQHPAERRTMTLTAYSSSVDETDSTPFITASGSKARDGVVASNDLPLGTRVRVPGVFGGRVFTVEDRMHRRYTSRKYLDFWMPSKQEALRFGLVRGVAVEILDK